MTIHTAIILAWVVYMAGNNYFSANDADVVIKYISTKLRGYRPQIFRGVIPYHSKLVHYKINALYLFTGQIRNEDAI